MLVIGLAGIWRIQSLSGIIDTLGKRNLFIARLVLEIGLTNTVYVMGVRNYALWQNTKYLGADSIMVSPEATEKSADELTRQVKMFASYAIGPQQAQWAKQLLVSVQQLQSSGKQVIEQALRAPNTMEFNRLLMDFENRFYKINEFLGNTLTVENFKETAQQIYLGYVKKREAILLLIGVLILGVAVGAVTTLWLYYNRKDERQRREEMMRQLITIEERERQNLSAQIHDQMAQDLSALKIYTGVSEQAIEANLQTREFKDSIGSIKKILSGLIEKTHNICLLLRPPALDEVGIVDSLDALILEYRQLTGINYVYEKPEKELTLSAEHSLLLYRLAQEALTNTAKYAQAKNVFVRLSRRQNEAEFLFKDDGIGFDYQNLMRRPLRRQEDKLRLGLLGLQERVELAGGMMRVESAPGKGTQIFVTLPI